MPNARRCPCVCQYTAISCLLCVSYATPSAFFRHENKKPKPALINEVQFHLACPVVIVQFKMLPAVPFRKTAVTLLLPIWMHDAHCSLSRFGCPDPKLGRPRNALKHHLSPRSVTLFWTSLVLEILLHSVLIFQSPLIFFQALNDVVDNRIVGINLEQ